MKKLLLIVAMFSVITKVLSEENTTDYLNMYVPGETKIEEENILKRMEAEIGQNLSLTKNDKNIAEIKKPVNNKLNTHKYYLNIVLKDQTVVNGYIQSNNISIDAMEQNDHVQQKIKILFKDIESIDFTEWEARRLTLGSKKDLMKVFFIPKTIIIHTIDDQKITATLHENDLLQIKLVQKNKIGEYRTYFTKETNISDVKTSSKEFLNNQKLINQDNIPTHIITKLKFQQDTYEKQKLSNKIN